MRGKKLIVTLLTVFVFCLASLSAACQDTPGVDTPPDSKEDVYEDYDSTKQPGESQFDYDGNYASPELVIDGKGDDPQWQSITEPLATFGKGGAAKVKVYRGEKALFFLFEVQDTILLTEGETNDDAVTRSDSIELYLDTLADGGLKPQTDDYQINLGIHGKTRIMQGAGNNWGNWNGLIDYEININGTLNDSNDANDIGYTIEVMIPYSQINIERDDTIGISFGHVDKIDMGGNQARVHWDWHPWIYGFVNIEPQTPNNYILLDKDNKLMSRDQQPKPNAEVAGYILDSKTNQPIEGAMVVLATEEEEIGRMQSNASGYYSFADVNPEKNYSILVTKDGYIDNSVTCTRAELRSVDGGRLTKTISLTNESEVSRTTISGTIKNLIQGQIEGASILVEGTTMRIESGENGAFSISDVPVAENTDVTLVITKDGFGESKHTIKYADLVVNGTTTIGDVSLNSAWAETGSFAGKSDKFSDLQLRLSRTLTGVEFYFTGSRVLSGRIELYLDTKECAGHRDQEYTFWQFQLNDNGTVQVIHYKSTATFDESQLQYTIYKNDETGYQSRFFVPYSYLGIEPKEVFGISLGQWSTTANDWDGWGFQGQFVAPETPATLIRLSATNQLYRENSNLSMVDMGGAIGKQGVRVEIGDRAVTTGADGTWHMRMPTPTSDIEIKYTCLGYEPKTDSVSASYFESNYAYYAFVELVEQKVSISGTITDSQTNQPIAGVSVSIEGTEISVTTGEDGAYTLSDLGTFTAAKVVFAFDGYASQNKTFTASELAAAASHSYNVSLVSNEQVKYITLSGTVSNVNGPVEGASISVQGTDYTATTNESGVWTIANFKAVDGTIAISKDGYISQSQTFTASAVGEESAFDMGEVDLWLNYVTIGALENKKTDHFAVFDIRVTRSKTALQFKLVGQHAFDNGQVEFYLDIGDVASKDYHFNLMPDGTVNVIIGANKDASQLTYVLTDKDTTPVIDFSVPYTFLGINPTDIIGVAAGQWSNDAADWEPMIRIFWVVDPNAPAGYVRVTSANEDFDYERNVRKLSISGNTGVGNVTVSIGSKTATSAATANPDWGIEIGNWSMDIDYPTTDFDITYTALGYVTKSQTITLSDISGYSHSAGVIGLDVQLVSISGTITDSQSNLPVAGVSVSIEGTEISATTGEDGAYTLSGVGTFNSAKVVFELDGYATQNKTFTASELAAGASHSYDVSLVSNVQIKKITLSGTVSNVNGPVEGATVTVEGTQYTATTNESGVWTIQDFNAIDGTIAISKDGYISQTQTFTASAVGEESAFDMGEVDLWLDYAVIGTLEDKKQEHFAVFEIRVTRSKTALQFKLVGKHAFDNGQVEFYLDIGEVASQDYRFDLKPDGTVSVGFGTNTDASQLTCVLTDKDTTPVIDLSIPYTFLGINPTDIIGVTAGQFSPDAGDWAPMIRIWWAVQPAETAKYARIPSDNGIYDYERNVRKLSISGNTGIGNVTVSIGSKTATSAAEASWLASVGDWNIDIDYPTSDVTITYTCDGYVTKSQTITLSEISGYSHSAGVVELVAVEG